MFNNSSSRRADATVASWVREEIRKLIFTKQLKAGERILQDEIAQLLGTSRMPVREAIKNLEVEGLIVMEPYRGATVAKFDAKDVKEIFLIKAALEPLALELAIENLTKKDINNLQDLNINLEITLNEGQYEKWPALNYEFHMVISEASKSPRLINLIKNYYKYPYRLDTIFKKNELYNNLNYHNKIIEAIKYSEIKQAKCLLKEHLLSGGKALALQIDPDYKW